MAQFTHPDDIKAAQSKVDMVLPPNKDTCSAELHAANRARLLRILLACGSSSQIRDEADRAFALQFGIK